MTNKAGNNRPSNNGYAAAKSNDYSPVKTSATPTEVFKVNNNVRTSASRSPTKNNNAARYNWWYMETSYYLSWIIFLFNNYYR